MNLTGWNLPSKKIVLHNDEIHLWLCNLKIPKQSISNLRQLLSKDELGKAEKFHFLKDRNSFIVSHASLRIILSKYVKVKPAGIKFILNKYGKPLLYKPNETSISFNLSHSGDFCLIAINRNDIIGVDIEKINEDFSSLEIAKNYFSKKEYTELFKLPSTKQSKAFFHCWTRKEAFIKAKGKGLSIALDSFDVTIIEKEAKITRIYNDINITKWQLYNVEVNDNYCAAIASLGIKKKVIKTYLEDANLI